MNITLKTNRICGKCEFETQTIWNKDEQMPAIICPVSEQKKGLLDNCDVEFSPVKTGLWIAQYPPINHIYFCSLCGQFGDRLWSYCPNCGAKMKQEYE